MRKINPIISISLNNTKKYLCCIYSFFTHLPISPGLVYWIHWMKTNEEWNMKNLSTLTFWWILYSDFNTWHYLLILKWETYIANVPIVCPIQCYKQSQTCSKNSGEYQKKVNEAVWTFRHNIIIPSKEHVKMCLTGLKPIRTVPKTNWKGINNSILTSLFLNSFFSQRLKEDSKKAYTNASIIRIGNENAI